MKASKNGSVLPRRRQRGERPFFRPVIQRQQMTSSDTAQETDAAGQTQLAGICFQTPFGGGEVKFTGFSNEALNRFRVIPEEECSTHFVPTANTWHDADGFWWAGETHPHRWFKISGHCEATVRPNGGSFSVRSCCNGVASLVKGTPHWSTDTLWSTSRNARCTNPFSSRP